MDNPHICALCYTQLYDVEQEQNGLYTYQREPKFSPKIYEQIRAQTARLRPTKRNGKESPLARLFAQATGWLCRSDDSKNPARNEPGRDFFAIKPAYFIMPATSSAKLSSRF